MNGETTALEMGITKKRVCHPERVTLTPDCAARIDHWNDQLSPKLSGRRLPRADFVNWLVLKQSADLSETDIVALHSEHFDPVRALEWAVKKVKEAQAKGESVNIHQFVDQTILKRTSTIKRKPIKPISVGKKVNVPKANDQEANKE